MKIEDALAFGFEQLQPSATATTDARRLLAHTDERLPAEPQQRYFELLARRERHEPLAYLLGRVPFRHVELTVTPDVLIPRPETEFLVEQALSWINGRSGLRCVDVGTGSGCIAISLAAEAPGNQVWATELSEAALRVAAANVQANDVAVDLLHGSLLEPLSTPIDLIVANLPYVGDDEWQQVEWAVRTYEPHVALRGGDGNGLALIGELLRQASQLIDGSGAIFLEIGYSQGQRALSLANEIFPQATVECLRDYAGNERVVAIRLGEEG